MKILFKNTLLVTIGICIGILVASIGVVVYSGLNIFLKSRVINISSEEMISKTSIIGIQIPEKAYNIDFYYDEWQDYTWTKR